ncbi:MAG TPA: SGNH/GDSL hydrolase family protein [Xanthomonadales bacterium]|nr:SGNH/GDSL hydrolase family protein [Xanthomonadales bacterium]
MTGRAFMSRLLSLSRSALTLLGQAWLILGITLLLLLIVDQILRAVLPNAGPLASLQPGVIAPGRSRAAAVADDVWIDAYWNEHQDSRHTQWVSYVYWRRQPFDDELIDIDAHGFRLTPPTSSPPLRTIWLFGGSTAWGTGNRNEATLAAQLQRIYAQRAPELGVRVLNFGESGYVSRQSLAAFQSALACPEPAADMAIFLDGANDVFAALQEGAAGLPQNEDNRRREFNSSRQLAVQLRAWALRLEGIARLLQPAASTADPAALDALAIAAADHYLALVEQAAALAQGRGIDLIHAWQPTVFDRAQPRSDEVAIVGASIASHVQLQRRARARVQQRLASDPTLALTAVDLGDAFAGSEQPVFFDFVHLSERGQALLAQRLFELSVERLGQRPARPAALASCRDRPLG